MKQKKILILGATISQMPLIKEAKEMGFYVIVCTYDPAEPGINVADEYHNVSTTDKEAVLELAKKKGVDAVASWASDVAAPPAAYVAESLGLVANPYESVKMLTDKSAFRNFLKKNGFPFPRHCVYTDQDVQNGFTHSLSYPVIVKPVDSSGGQGVVQVFKAEELPGAAELALSYSGSRKIIVEESIEMIGSQIHGDGFVLNGELVFSYLGDHIFTGKNGLIPVGTSWPSRMPPELLSKAENEVRKCIKASGFQFGPVNIEARIDKNYNVYIIELAPRIGVNSGSGLIKLGARVDLAHETMKILDGQQIEFEAARSGCVAYYLLHTETDGIFSEFVIDPEIEKYITDVQMKVKKGDRMKRYQNMANALGLIHFKFNDQNTMHKTLGQMQNHLFVIAEDKK